MKTKKLKHATYSRYVPKYFPKMVDKDLPTEHCERWLVKIEDSFKDAYHRATNSLSVAYYAVDNTHGVRIEIPSLNVILECSTSFLKQHGTMLTFHEELKIYLPLDKWTKTQGPDNWIDLAKASL